MPVRRRYHFHAPGLVYVFVTVLIALGAFNSQNNLLFWAFGFALAILIVSGLISGQMLMGIRAARTAAPRGTVGEPLTLSYRITNRSRIIPAFAIGAVEHAEPANGSGRRRRRSAAPALAYTFLVHLGPREASDITARLTPDRRGVLRLSDFSLETTFPFGIVRKSLLFRQERTVLVHPRPIAPPAGILSRRRTGSMNDSPRAARPGDGEDFFALREYVPGDSPRSIAWRASARSDTVLVRQASQPVPQRLLVLLRLDPAQPESVNESAISRAAGLISAAAGAAYEVGLIVPRGAVERRPGPGRAQAMRLLDDLALIDLSSAPPRPARLPAVATRGTLTVAIHAGPADPSFGPPGTIHLSAIDGPQAGAQAHAGTADASPSRAGAAAAATGSPGIGRPKAHPGSNGTARHRPPAGPAAGARP